MNRSILGIVTFFLTFGISVSLVGLFVGFPSFTHEHGNHGDYSARKSITGVLDKDHNYGTERSGAFLNLAMRIKNNSDSSQIDAGERTFAELTSAYAADSSSIDVSHTPADFQYAWAKHMEAWKNNSKALSATEKSKSEIKKTNDEIASTWNQVIRIAERYGVNTGRYPH